jgi:hypothetical protein
LNVLVKGQGGGEGQGAGDWAWEGELGRGEGGKCVCHTTPTNDSSANGIAKTMTWMSPGDLHWTTGRDKSV